MGDLSIKIKILDREYPMKVKLEDEPKIRAIGKLINERIRGYAHRFKIDDKQDLLAMVAFDSLMEKAKTEDNQQMEHTHLLQTLEELHAKIDHNIG
jgi:cell division protein ZapA